MNIAGRVNKIFFEKRMTRLSDENALLYEASKYVISLSKR